MQKSGPNNPCPMCDRVHDADCRITDDGLVLCHTHLNGVKKGEKHPERDFIYCGQSDDAQGFGKWLPSHLDDPSKKAPREPREYLWTYQFWDGTDVPVQRKRVDRPDGDKWVGWADKFRDRFKQSDIAPFQWHQTINERDLGLDLFVVKGERKAEQLTAAGHAAISILDPSERLVAELRPFGQQVILCPDNDLADLDHWYRELANQLPDARHLFPTLKGMNWREPPADGGLGVEDWLQRSKPSQEQVTAAITTKPWDASETPVSEWEQRKLAAIDSANGDPLLVCDALLSLLHDKAQEIIHSSRRINEQKLAIKAVARDLGFNLTKQEVDDLFLQVDTALGAYEPPVEPGGEFLTYSQSWLLQGLFLIGLNLLVGMPGAGKSRLLVAVVRAFLSGQSTFLQRELLSGTDRQVLIIGTDQDRQQWGDLLAEVGLATVVTRETLDGQEQVLYRLHERITLHTSGGGFRLDADGLRYIRDWCHANHGGLLLIDSLSAVLPAGVSEGDESAGRLIRQIEVARQGNTCIVTHHCNKQSAMSGELGVYSGSGHGSIDRAVSRFVGLGYETHIQNGRERLHEESPRRVITSQKRGAVNQRLIVENGSANTWDYISTAAEDREMKRQAAEGDVLDRLKGWKKAIHSVLSSTWQTTSAIAEALPADYADKANALKQVQRNLREMEQDGLIESDPTSIGEGRWRFPLT